MLHLLISRTKVVVGLDREDHVQLIPFDGEPYLSISGHSPLKSFDQFWPKVWEAVQASEGELGDEPIATFWAIPAGASTAEHSQIRQQLMRIKSPKLELIHDDNLVVSYLAGLRSEAHISEEQVVAIESMEQRTHVCFFKEPPVREDAELLQSANPFAGENFECLPIKDFGPAAGNEKVLSEILTALTEAGMKVDFKGQTDLALQLEKATSPYLFQINQETDKVTLAGEVRLSDGEYESLMTHNRERLDSHVSKNSLGRRNISQVVLLGDFLHQPSVLNYLNHDLALNGQVLTHPQEDYFGLFEEMLQGLKVRSAQVLRLKRLQEEEEARRAKLAAELKAKEDRETLLERLTATCTDPEKKDEYEAEFVPKGAELGIPEVVIKWNISEALNRVELDKEATKAGIKQETPEEPEPQPEPVKPSSNGKSRANGKASSNGKGKASKPEPKPEPKPQPEPVAAGGSSTQANKQTATQPVAEKVAEPEAKTEPVQEPQAKKSEAEKKAAPKEEPKKRPSLGAIFMLNGTLEGEEFPSRKATFKGDTAIKLVRLLPQEDRLDEQQLANFEKLYQKEREYYGSIGEISELSEAKEGLYFFRDFIERTTLKEFVKRIGLDRKQKVEDLSSEDLKFILQVFKSIQELPVSHANISEDNILVINKRRGILRRSSQAEVRFTGFTSEDISPEGMTEATHAAFSRILGEPFYTSFRKQFQL